MGSARSYTSNIAFRVEVLLTGFIAVNDDHWPLVIAVHNGLVEIEEMDRYYERVRTYYARDEQHCTLTDLANIVSPSREMRKHEAERIKAYKDDITRSIFASALVVPSPVIRIVLNSIFFIQRPPMPYHVCPSSEEAWLWLEKKFQEMGQTMPVSREKCAEIVLSLRESES